MMRLHSTTANVRDVKELSKGLVHGLVQSRAPLEPSVVHSRLLRSSGMYSCTPH
jgi:hypothetical protein